MRTVKTSLAILGLVLLGMITTPLLAAEADAPVIARILARGELIVGTSGNMPPMTQVDANGKLSGFDIDIARLMANLMEVKLKSKVLPFDELLPALQRGEVDAVISNLTITPKRNLQVAFVGPYMTSGKCIITKDEALAKASDESVDINRPETKIVVLKGSTSADFASILLPDATLITVDDHAKGAALVKDGKASGMLTDYPICLSTVQLNPDAGFASVFSLLSYEPIGIALPANDPLLINWTENFLQRLEGTDTFKDLTRRWFGQYNLPQ